MPSTERLPTRLRNRPAVVVAGGGVAALEALLALRALAGESLAVQLVAAERHFWYRPLAVAEPFDLGTSHRLPLELVAHETGAEFVPGVVTHVDWEHRTASLAHGPELGFDALLLATGARPRPAVPGAFTFRGPADTEVFGQLLREAEAGAVGRLVFTAPTGAAWHLPLYELALLTERRLVERGVRDRVELALVTPEDRPLQAFGPAASDAVTDVLDERGVEFLGGLHPDAFADGILSVLPRASIPATHVVALPRLEGAAPGGLPHDRNGFVAVDRYCRVRGIDSVYAAGDVTTLPVKQGGLAAQQADAAASSIAADLGLGAEREPFSPVLRGLLLTGGEPQYLRADIGAGKSDADVDPLWWPPAKIVGRHLAPYLAARAGVLLDAPTGAVVPVEIAVRG